MTNQIQILNLPGDTNRIKLKNIFLQFGHINSVTININPITGRSLGTAQIRFETSDASEAAIKTGFIDYHSQRLEIKQI